MIRIIGLAAGVAAAAAAFAMVAAGPSAATARGVERMPAQCGANILDHQLTIGIATPDSTLPIGWDWLPPAGSYAYANGFAVFTPDRHMAVVCNQDGSTIYGSDWGKHYVGGAYCSLMRGGGVPLLPGIPTDVYEGRGVVSVHGSHVLITCFGKFTHVFTWPPS